MFSQNMNVAIYARVSTEMQEEKDSLNNQIDRCKTFCEMKGYNIVKVYTDVESGSKDNRHDFQKMLKDMNLGVFQAIVVTELSRISRKISTLIKFLEDFQACGVNFVSITQDIDTSTLMGRTFFQLIGVLSEFERGQTRERVAHTMQNMAKRGKFTGGVVPFGYELVDKQLIINENEAEIIREAYRLYISGISKFQIAKRLSLPNSTLNRILNTPFYTGKVVYNRRKSNPVTGKMENQPKDSWIISEGEHEAIIDEQSYEMSQEIFNNNYRPQVKFKDNPNFLLSGLIQCYNGHKMYGHTSSNGSKYYLCYRNSSKYDGNNKCTQYSINAEQLENEVVEYILSLKEMNSKVESIKNGKNQPTDKLPYLNKEKQNILSKKDKLISLVLDNKIDSESFDLKNKELSKSLDSIEKQIHNLSLQTNDEKLKITNQEIFYKILNEIYITKNSSDLKQLLGLLINQIKFINDFEYEIIFNI